MKNQTMLTSLLASLSVLVLGSCTTSVTVPPVNTSVRTVTATLPTPIAMNRSVHANAKTKSFVDACDYNAVEALPITCIAVASTGDSIVSAPVDAENTCSFELSKNESYQYYLMQDGVYCAELWRSDSSRPTVIGKSESDFAIGQLSHDGSNNLIAQNDPEAAMDSDADGTVDSEDLDVDGNGVDDTAEDCDHDGISDGVDTDDDGDGMLDLDSDEVNNIEGDDDSCYVEPTL